MTTGYEQMTERQLMYELARLNKEADRQRRLMAAYAHRANQLRGWHDRLVAIREMYRAERKAEGTQA